MKYRLMLLCAGLGLVSGALSAQVHFTRRSDLLALPGNHFSGVAMAVLDMNDDGRDDIVRMNQGVFLSIEQQTAPLKPFTHRELATLQSGTQWGVCAADMDNNGFPDILTGGFHDGIKIIRANAGGSAYAVDTLQVPATFTQGINFTDLDNDGWLDAFVCHDEGISRIFRNDGSGHLIYSPGQIDLHTVPPSNGSGNYGSVWSDVDNDGDPDLYLAKCESDVPDPGDGRRINQLFLNNGNGTFTQDTTNASGLRIGAQSWSADFGDMDNDGDFDCFLTNHDVSSQLMENDGAGHFTDISGPSGIYQAVEGLPIQGIFRDFDNDGYVDILVAGSSHYLFRNNGNKTFSKQPILDDHQMESFAVGDLNFDGFPDIYAGYADLINDPGAIPDALWINDGNAHHFFGLNLHGVQSNRSGVGAKVRLFSALGVQTREVRSGESYGIMNSMQLHFGLGQDNKIDSVHVYWPSGVTDRLYNPAPDQYLTLQEGGCVAPVVDIAASGSTVFCNGDSVVLSAPAGYAAYLWNTGSTGPSIVVASEGTYFVRVTAAGGCSAVSDFITTTVFEPALPLPVGDTVKINTAATLSAAGEQLKWYDAATGGNVLFSGTPFLTPPLTQSTTFWVTNTQAFDFYPYECESERVPVPAVVDSVVSGVPRIVPEEQIRLYPNPATDQVSVEWPRFPGGELAMVVKNVTGAILQKQETKLPAGDLHLPVQLSGLSAGVYWIALRTPEQLVCRKLVLY